MLSSPDQGGAGMFLSALASQPLAHAFVLSFFPGYPAAIDSLHWLPGVGTALAGLTAPLLVPASPSV